MLLTSAFQFRALHLLHEQKRIPSSLILFTSQLASIILCNFLTFDIHMPHCLILRIIITNIQTTSFEFQPPHLPLFGLVLVWLVRIPREFHVRLPISCLVVLIEVKLIYLSIRTARICRIAYVKIISAIPKTWSERRSLINRIFGFVQDEFVVVAQRKYE